MALNVSRLAFGASRVTTFTDYFFCGITGSLSVYNVSPTYDMCRGARTPSKRER